MIKVRTSLCILQAIKNWRRGRSGNMASGCVENYVLPSLESVCQATHKGSVFFFCFFERANLSNVCRIHVFVGWFDFLSLLCVCVEDLIIKHAFCGSKCCGFI